MKKVINYENIRYFAYSNDKICVKPIKGIVFYFFGCGNQPDFKEDDMSSSPNSCPDGRELAEEGILLLIPYYNPWSWMNKRALDFTGEILSVLKNKYSLPDDIPLVSSGLSMGGLAALVYAKETKPAPAACVLDCPVCDLADFLAYRPYDAFRTVYSAFYSAGEPGTLEDAYKKNSPLHCIDALPKIEYFIFQCEEDKHLRKETQSGVFVREMLRRGHTITYHTIPGRAHCDLPEDSGNLFREYIKSAILNRNSIFKS